MRALLVLLAILIVPALAWGEMLSPPDAERRAEHGELTIVDVRLPAEWAETGLPRGALGIPLQDSATYRLRPGFLDDLLQAVGGDPDRPVALICASGNRSALAADLLARAGFSHVYDISEGMVGGPNGPGWLERDLPTEPCRAC
jgi:rhodanese-related sulfurtransferase